MGIQLSQSQQRTKTFLFEKEFLGATANRRKAEGRLFAGRIIVAIRIVNSETIRLSHIETFKLLRERGFASECLKWLCELADAHDVTLLLGVVALENRRTRCEMELYAWYQRHGFKRLYGNEMIRYPKGQGQ